jgi:hypothetical protein
VGCGGCEKYGLCASLYFYSILKPFIADTNVFLKHKYLSFLNVSQY